MTKTKRKKEKKKVEKQDEVSYILKGCLVGIQLEDDSRFVGEVVKVSTDYLRMKMKESRKPVDIPRIAIKRMLILVKGGKE